MNLGFMGLGQMGKHCASNLLKKHGSLGVYDIDRNAAQALSAQGAKSFSSVREMAEQSDIIFLCLPHGGIVENVLFVPDGLLSGLKSGKIVVDLSTIDYLQCREIAQRLEGAGMHFLDAPISGMEAKARSGELSIMCGGSQKIFDKVSPYLAFMGTSVVYLGQHGSGQFAKMVNNVLYNINMAGLAEILPFAVRMGLEPEKIAQFVNAGTGRSYASEYFLPRILEGDFSYGFTLENAYKDMQSACNVSAKEKIPVPVLHAAMTTYQMTLLEGHGRDYKGGMIKVFERLLNVAFRKKLQD